MWCDHTMSKVETSDKILGIKGGNHDRQPSSLPTTGDQENRKKCKMEDPELVMLRKVFFHV